MASHQLNHALDCNFSQEPMTSEQTRLSAKVPEDADLNEAVGAAGALSNAMQAPQEKTTIILQDLQLPVIFSISEKKEVRQVVMVKNRRSVWQKKKSLYKTNRMMTIKAIRQRKAGMARLARLDSRIERLAELSDQIRRETSHLHRSLILQQELDQAHQRCEQAERKLAEQSHQAQKNEDLHAEKDLKHREKIQRLRNDLRILHTQNKELNAKLAAQEKFKAQTQRFANPNKTSDDTIISIWERLRYNIHNVAENLLTGRPWEMNVDDDLALNHQSPVLDDMKHQHFELLQNDDWRSSVLESYIWLSIIVRFFEPDADGIYGKCWGGSIGQSLCNIFCEVISLVDAKNPRVTDLTRWKADGARLVDEMIGVDEYELRKAAEADTATFSIFLPGGTADEKSSEKLFTSLNRIFQDAVQLQASFMTSKAIFLLKWPEVCRSTGIISFDPERMDAEIWEKEPLDKNSIVKLTISPGLMKAGTADGEDYDQRLLLTSARVVCN